MSFSLLKAVFVFLILSFGIGCTQTSNGLNGHLLKQFEITGHWANHCGGVDVPVCRYWVEGVQKDRSKEYAKWGVKFLGEDLLKSILTGK